MLENSITLIALLSPAAFVAIAIASWFYPGNRPKQVILFSKVTSVLSVLIAGICSFFVAQLGTLESGLIGSNQLGFSIRLDALSLIMLSMIALLGFIIIKFSINYLDGDQKQGAFLGRLAATIASVQLLVLSGNIGLLFISWVLTSMSLHRLLIFYQERPGAQIAAKKKFIVARLGDTCLFIALGLLYYQSDTGNLEAIFTTVKNVANSGEGLVIIEFSAVFLALAALLKSAQFPTYGWLIEVMETPTPVSALLHAGLLNAGPFLIIRMAFVMDASTIAPLVLMGIGGLTALFASLVYLTQTSVKTALGYSSVGHMGFSLMVCGLGVYSAAMLHLVAHSFYKAHAFLSSGSVIDIVRSSKVIRLKQTFNMGKVALGVALALGLYTLLALYWGIDFEKEQSLLFIGAIITLGLSRLFVSAFARQWNTKLIAQAALFGLIVTVAFFTLESATHYLLFSQIPELTSPGIAKFLLASLILMVFGLAIILQMLAPQLSHKPIYHELAIHMRNGFYVNAWFDRLVRALSVHSLHTTQVPNIPADPEIADVRKLQDLKKQLA